MIKYIIGDVFASSAQLIAHGCNCKGSFGYGVAEVVKTRYPKAKDMYMKKYQSEGWRLGEVQVVPVKSNLWIANCATQLNYGSPRGGKVYVDYKAIKVVMQELKNNILENNWTLAMPKIGAGLAGGDWDKIESIINEVFEDIEVLVYELPQKN